MSKTNKKKERSFLQAVRMEIKEHKSTFIVFSVLYAFTVLSLVRQFFLGNYEGFFLCVLTLVLLLIPSIIQVEFRIEFPTALEIIILCFIFAAEILGEINSFFIKIPLWDTALHTMNGFLAAAIGFSLAALLNENKQFRFSMSPLFVAIVAFCFSMTIGVLWEFFEFAMDTFLHFDMQKDTVIHSMSSVMLDPTGGNNVIRLSGINDVLVNGESLGTGGYLDIGLIDTMGDLFVNFVGAVLFSVLGFFYYKSKGKGRLVERFIPRKKDADKDYLKSN